MRVLFYRIILVAGAMVACLPIQSQSIRKALLLDKKTRFPIPFATIKVLNQPYGGFTNENGFFEVRASLADTLLISSIGYQSLEQFQHADTIYMQPLAANLPSVTVSQKRIINSKTVGIKAASDFRWGPSGYGEEFAQKIFLDLKENEFCFLKKVIFSVKDFSPSTPVLLHVYSVDPVTGFPKDELLMNRYLVTSANFRKGKIEVDISPEKLYSSDSCLFVSFEWLSSGPDNHSRPGNITLLDMTNKFKEALTYSRTLRYPSYNWFQLPQINGKLANTICQVEVDILK